jgi:hypothetical protein
MTPFRRSGGRMALDKRFTAHIKTKQYSNERDRSMRNFVIVLGSRIAVDG